MFLHLSGYLRANHRAAANVLLSRIGKAISIDVSTANCERYWKDGSLFRFHVTLELPPLSLENALLEQLRRVEAISGRWNISVPVGDPEGDWHFGGTAERTSIPGVSLVDFTLATTDSRVAPPSR